MKVELLSVADVINWDKYVLKHDRSLFNASYQFRTFLRHLLPSNCIPFYFLAKEGNDVLGVLPSFCSRGSMGAVLNSMPWFGSNPGGMADSMSVQKALLEAFLDTAEWTKCISATFITRPFEDLAFYDDFFSNYEHLEDERIGAITTLPSYQDAVQFSDDLLNLVHQKTRNQIRKSWRFCQVSEKQDFSFLEKIHQENMEAVGAPVKSKEFEIIKNQLKPNEDYKMFIAWHGGEPVAGLLLKYFNKTVDYLVPAIDVNYRHFDPLHSCIYYGMVDAAQNGFKYWNWGGSKLPGMESVLHFKQRFGADICKYKYYTFLPMGTNPFELIAPDYWLKNYPYFYVLPFKTKEAGKP